jgi:hypothetical protein
MKSLKIFIEEKQSHVGVRISASPLILEDKILSIPFYLSGELSRLAQEISH